MSNTDIFFDIKNDLNNYPEAVILLEIGGRGTGKTYSSLKHMYESHSKFIFMKRTNGDVKLLCQSLNKKEQEFTIDVSPFKPINRDLGCNVRAFRLYDGFGGFWKCDENNQPVGDPLGYILSFNAISKFKGFDLSDCDYIIFDEFIPQKYERVNKHEGLELMDLYRTVSRANRTLFGKQLKILCLANATDISCPVINDLELADTIAEMQAKGQEYNYIGNRNIFIHLIGDINGFREMEEKDPIYKVMDGTEWKDMSLNNQFAFNDFSNVKRSSLKNMECLCRIIEKKKEYYVYVGESGYYMTYRKSNHPTYTYDLNREVEQKNFYISQDIDLRAECIDDNMRFETFHMYDLIMNFTSFYDVR